MASENEYGDAEFVERDQRRRARHAMIDILIEQELEGDDWIDPLFGVDRHAERRACAAARRKKNC